MKKRYLFVFVMVVFSVVVFGEVVRPGGDPPWYPFGPRPSTAQGYVDAICGLGGDIYQGWCAWFKLHVGEVPPSYYTPVNPVSGVPSSFSFGILNKKSVYDVGDSISLSWSGLPSYAYDSGAGCTVWWFVNGVPDNVGWSGYVVCGDPGLRGTPNTGILKQAHCYGKTGVVTNSVQMFVKDAGGNVLAKSGVVGYTINCASVLVFGVGELKVVLIGVIQDYFLHPGNSKLNLAELKDLLVVYLSTPSDTISLSGVGSFSGKNLLDIYNKAKGEVITQSCAAAGGSCKPSTCGSYSSCSSVSGACSSGFCCSGACTISSGPGDGTQANPYKLDVSVVDGTSKCDGGGCGCADSPKTGHYCHVFQSEAGGRIRQNKDVSFEVDLKGYTGKSFDFFLMLVKGFTNNECLLFYYAAIDKRTGNILVPETRIHSDRSLGVTVAYKSGKGRILKPFSEWGLTLDDVKYIYRVVNSCSDKYADAQVFWLGGCYGEC